MIKTLFQKCTSFFAKWFRIVKLKVVMGLKMYFSFSLNAKFLKKKKENDV